MKKSDLLHLTRDALGMVIPFPKEYSNSSYPDVCESHLGVQIGFTGDINGRFIIQGTNHSFSTLGEAMFGMPMEGGMLHSFSGELANMIFGNLSTSLHQQGVTIDISPPTILEGASEPSNMDQRLEVDIQIEGKELRKVLIIEKE